MTGTVVNTVCIIVGSIIGAVLKRKISVRYQKALYNAMGLCALVLGVNSCVQNIPKSEYPVLFIVSLALGSVIGYTLRLSERFDMLSMKLGSRKHAKMMENKRLGEGLSTGILLYCIGTLSMLGPVMSALHGDDSFLYTNATLDFVTSAVLASIYGIGMVWAAPVLFFWQGLFYLAATLSSNMVSESLMTELAVVGGVLIASTGLSILGVKDCKTVNMLPSLFVPILFFAIWSIFV